MEKEKALTKLAASFGDQLSIAESLRHQHGTDEGGHAARLPDAVLFAHSTEDVAAAMSICAEYKLPVVAYGAGTSLEGHITCPQGGLSLDLSRMNKVLAINAEDMNARIQAGITRKTLNSHLRDKGLFMPIDPGADATVGGMIATRASGTNAVKYGTIREQLLSLQVVTATGEIIETGTSAKKSAAGYDLTHLFCGSEGTLGIITEATLRLHGIPEKIAAGSCCFDTTGSAVNTVITLIQMGLAVSRLELLDDISVTAVNSYSKTSFPAKPTLFIEFSGSPAEVTEQITTFKEVAEEFGCTGIQFAETQEAINHLWHARHQLYYATRALEPGKSSLTTDVCVPISKLANCIAETRADLDSTGLTATILGHVGDGNFHTIVLYDKEAEAEKKAVQNFSDRLARRAIDMGGTCTGEHGIGTGKQAYLEWERGASVTLMHQIKQTLDPKNILNPGKIFKQAL